MFILHTPFNKRIYKIAELVSKMKIPVRWVHFGEGDGRKQVEGIIKTFPATANAELRGYTSNKVIKEFYATECVNLFINVSEAEGIPVFEGKVGISDGNYAIQIIDKVKS